MSRTSQQAVGFGAPGAPPLGTQGAGQEPPPQFPRARSRRGSKRSRDSPKPRTRLCEQLRVAQVLPTSLLSRPAPQGQPGVVGGLRFPAGQWRHHPVPHEAPPPRPGKPIPHGGLSWGGQARDSESKTLFLCLTGKGARGCLGKRQPRRRPPLLSCWPSLPRPPRHPSEPRAEAVWLYCRLVASLLPTA